MADDKRLTLRDITAWLDTAQPDELVEAGSKIVNKIGSLNPQYQDRFVEQVDKTTLRMFQKEPSHG